MTAIDPDHLFFLASDKAKFTQEYGKNYVYYNVAYLGNLDAAYEMYNTYEARATARINWIFAELKQDFDFTGNDAYAIDRSKAEFPATQADADSLWRRRLKFELLTEILNKKPPDQARKIIHKRYEVMLKNLGDTEAGDLAELYLTSVAGLFDPHSAYYSADSYEEFGIQMKLHLDGIGAMLLSHDNYCTVEELVPGGPAELGHQLKPHDKIISVAQDGQDPVDIIGMKLRKVVNMIRGQKGTRVHLLVAAGQRQGPLHPQGNRHHPRCRETRLRPRPRRNIPGARRQRTTVPIGVIAPAGILRPGGRSGHGRRTRPARPRTSPT